MHRLRAYMRRRLSAGARHLSYMHRKEPAQPAQSFTMPTNHRFVSSIASHVSMRTACGRTFDSAVFAEVIQAMQDRQWQEAVMRTLREDTEYLQSVRDEGSALQDVEAMIKKGVSGDEEFLSVICERMKTDVRLSLCLCAIQEAYTKVRSKRDRHATEKIASGSTQSRDMFSEFKKTQPGFSS